VDFAIRAGALGETADVLALWRSADAVPSATDDPDGIKLLIESDPGALLVAVLGDRVVGSLIAAFDGWRGSMYRLAVLPEFRRHGIASALVAAGEERLRGQGVRRMTAMILEEHDEAILLWEHCGYERDARMGRWIKTL
jgi:ribosomal protein S18 acetylase RimI-like enzyme